MQPEQAEFLLQTVFLPGLKNEHRITAAVIQAIPPDKGGYRPDEVSKSASDLAWHIVSSEMMFLNGVTAGEFDFTPWPRPESAKDPAGLALWYQENFDPLFEKLTKLSGEQLVKVLDFRGFFNLPAVMYLNFVLSHSVHHRGQLSTYLRPMGAKVPAIYGQSFDSAAALKSAQAS
jgi:uncharacterized damage-inducible protein DinB